MARVNRDRATHLASGNDGRPPRVGKQAQRTIAAAMPAQGITNSMPTFRSDSLRMMLRFAW